MKDIHQLLLSLKNGIFGHFKDFLEIRGPVILSSMSIPRGFEIVFNTRVFAETYTSFAFHF